MLVVGYSLEWCLCKPYYSSQIVWLSHYLVHVSFHWFHAYKFIGILNLQLIYIVVGFLSVGKNCSLFPKIITNTPLCTFCIKYQSMGMGIHVQPFIFKPIEMNMQITIGSMCYHNKFWELQIDIHILVYLVGIESNRILNPNLKRQGTSPTFSSIHDMLVVV